MSRSLFVPLASCALAAFLLAPGFAGAQDFSEADFFGDYAVSFTSEGGSDFANRNGAQFAVTGVVHSDGLGSVSGAWIVSREFWPPPSDPFGSRSEVFEQTMAGTYSVSPDGVVSLSVQLDPNPVWFNGSRFSSRWDETRLESTVSLILVLARGGDIARGVVGLDGVVWRVLAVPPPGAVGLRLWNVHVQLSGTAERQDPVDDSRIDVLSAQLCEVLRLLNTPQGQRETSTPEVLDACGTGYEWNDAVSRLHPRERP